MCHGRGSPGCGFVRMTLCAEGLADEVFFWCCSFCWPPAGGQDAIFGGHGEFHRGGIGLRRLRENSESRGQDGNTEEEKRSNPEYAHRDVNLQLRVKDQESALIFSLIVRHTGHFVGRRLAPERGHGRVVRGNEIADDDAHGAVT